MRRVLLCDLQTFVSGQRAILIFHFRFVRAEMPLPTKYLPRTGQVSICPARSVQLDLGPRLLTRYKVLGSSPSITPTIANAHRLALSTHTASSVSQSMKRRNVSVDGVLTESESSSIIPL